MLVMRSSLLENCNLFGATNRNPLIRVQIAVEIVGIEILRQQANRMRHLWAQQMISKCLQRLNYELHITKYAIGFYRLHKFSFIDDYDRNLLAGISILCGRWHLQSKFSYFDLCDFCCIAKVNRSQPQCEPNANFRRAIVMPMKSLLAMTFWRLIHILFKDAQKSFANVHGRSVSRPLISTSSIGEDSDHLSLQASVTIKCR